MYKSVRTDHSDPIQSFFMSRYDRISYFSNLDIKMVEELSYFLEVKIFEINQVILEPAMPCPGIYFVFKGAVVIFLNHDGTEVELDWLGRGSVIGQHSCFSDDELLFGARSSVIGGTACLVLDRECLDCIRSRRNIFDSIA